MLKYTILIVDDDQDILDFLSYNIRKEGYRVLNAENGQVALNICKQVMPVLILMDVMMPVMDGIEACQEIRSIKCNTPPIITFLTSLSEDYSQIAGFQVGADDYITKPIRTRLLISKIKSLIRRYEKSNSSSYLQKDSSSLKINRDRFTVEYRDQTLNLPKKEFELLELLSGSPGKVFTRNQILSLIWGKDIVVGDRTVDVHIRKLREKFGNELIKTIKGVGYKLTG